MSEALQKLASTLETISDTIIEKYGSSDAAKAYPAEQTWAAHSRTAFGAADGYRKLADKLQSLTGVESRDEEIVEAALVMASQAFFSAANCQATGQNGAVTGELRVKAHNALNISLDSLMVMLSPLWDWRQVHDKALPANIRRRLTGVSNQVDQLDLQAESLTSKIELIHEAHDAAVSLPTDLKYLKQTHADIKNISEDAVKAKTLFGQSVDEGRDALKKLQDARDEANAIVGKCDEAYRVTTSAGLAGAFDARAKELKDSMGWWVGLLVFSLVIAGIYSGFRISALSEVLSNSSAGGIVIFTQLLISVFGLGAPLWVAWLSTKRVGQLFKLAEDYSYKATISKAYEGYRKEASRLDERLETQLFESAIGRLDEIPLRLVEGSNHGSPYSELLSSKEVQRLMHLAPELKDDIVAAVHGRFKKNRGEPVGSDQPSASIAQG